MMIDTFNIRVYVFLEHKDQVLILREPYAGEVLHKLPGGGLEFGEGPIDCLHRECMEELNIEITTINHLYTTDFFQQSKYRTNEQLMAIYYTAKVVDIAPFQLIDKAIEQAIWVPKADLNTKHVNLPVDKIALERYLKLG